MTRNRLTLSGWLAMVSAAMTIPWVVMTFTIADKRGGMAKTAEVLLLLIGTALFVYLLMTLRRLLHENGDFHEADTAIDLLVKANIVFAALGVFAYVIPSMEAAIGVFSIIMIVAIGIFQTMFGVRFLRFTDDLRGLQRPYAYLNIVTGVCTAIVVLLPLGVLTSAVADVMLATIFFQAAAVVKPEVPEG